jgi:hypothetical protein
VEPIPRAGPQLFDLDPKDEIAGIKIDEWRADQGLPPTGDPRGDMMMAAGVKPGGPSAPLAASPEAAPAAPGSAPLAPPPPPAAARLEHEEPDDEDDDPDEDARRSVRAAAMNEHGAVACRHNRTGSCPRCGVRGNWMPRAGGGWAVTWAPLRRSSARARAADPALAVAAAQLQDAVAMLEQTRP